MIDLFYPPSPQAYRHGRVVKLLTPEEALQREPRRGRDPAKAKARQARYRARMRLDPARYAKKLEQNKAFHAANRESELAKMKARREAKRLIADSATQLLPAVQPTKGTP